MAGPSFEDIKASTEKAESFVDWLDQQWRHRKWVAHWR